MYRDSRSGWPSPRYPSSEVCCYTWWKCLTRTSLERYGTLAQSLLPMCSTVSSASVLQWVSCSQPAIEHLCTKNISRSRWKIRMLDPIVQMLSTMGLSTYRKLALIRLVRHGVVGLFRVHTHDEDEEAGSFMIQFGFVHRKSKHLAHSINCFEKAHSIHDSSGRLSSRMETSQQQSDEARDRKAGPIWRSACSLSMDQGLRQPNIVVDHPSTDKTHASCR